MNSTQERASSSDATTDESRAGRCARARERAGLSRAQALRVLGFPTDHIERGAEEPTRERLEAMAEAYGVSVCWLLGHDTEPNIDELRRLASDKRVSDADWREIADFAAMTWSCDSCATEKGTRT
jgi:transcriptional regulator with XRE-family HTH domain